MARDTSNAAANNSSTAQGLATNYGSSATANSNILTPTLNSMIANPQGYGQRAMANMNTAAMQSAGGANSGTAGGSFQRAAATNNAGGFAPAVAQSGHDATAQLSDAALGVQNRNAQLQEQQREQGISGLEAMYQTNVGAGENALGLSNSALNTKTSADNSTWNNWLNLAKTASGFLTPTGG